VSEQRNIPGLFAQVVDRVNTTFYTRLADPFSVYFYHGAHDVVSKQLKSLDNSITMKDLKYPMIWLVTPIRENIPVGTEFACEISDVDILICMKSDSTSSGDERNTAYFEKYLRPIYEELKKQISNSYLFGVLSPNAIPHEAKEWPYHSGTEAASGKVNLFDDFIDCLQIRRMKLEINHSQNFVNT
jgi:hypothetical protein